MPQTAATAKITIYDCRTKGHGPWGSKAAWYRHFSPNMAKTLWLYDGLTAAACAKGLKLACDMWTHYREGTGNPFLVDVDSLLASDPGFRNGVTSELNKMKKAVREACGAKACMMAFDSKWQGVAFTGEDGAVAIGNVQIRITGSMRLDRRGRSLKLRASYKLQIYKDWNFDKGKRAKGSS